MRAPPNLPVGQDKGCSNHHAASATSEVQNEVKEESKIFFSPAQWAVVKDAVDGKTTLNIPAAITA
ncbi:hypothetical protein TrVGV298_008147 [Trichoderma virens]|nr:hypothetical protein TrVGV298_008147 [Trichoderma virens]